MGFNINSIKRITKRGRGQRLLVVCGNADWDKEHPDSGPSRHVGIGQNSGGDIEFSFQTTPHDPHEYLVTLTPAEIARAYAILHGKLGG